MADTGDAHALEIIMQERHQRLAHNLVFCNCPTDSSAFMIFLSLTAWHKCIHVYNILFGHPLPATQ